MRVLLIATYELGHQPLHLASPAAALQAAGHEVVCRDLTVEPWQIALIDTVDAVAFSVPMHTAMRLAVQAARAVRSRRPELPICLYGLYAPVSRDTIVGTVADRVIAGEYEAALVGWVDGLAGGDALASEAAALIELGRAESVLPARRLLPPLDRYARAVVGEEERLVGYVEATHGCAHTCRHCPVPTVYGGRVRLVQREAVLADVEQLVAVGGRHITFGDPDFLNGWRHALRTVEEMHGRFPSLTFDCTVKVEHILRHAEVWPRLAAAGCVFVVSALECVNDRILGLLDKGHTAADAARAVQIVRDAGITLRPSFMPFTPWTSASDIMELLDFVAAHDLIGNVDPVQYTIRLLVPEGSWLLDVPELAVHLDGYDAEALTWRWRSADPAMDRLQRELAQLVERHHADGAPLERVVSEIRSAAARAAGLDEPVTALPAGSIEGRPRLTEPWFC
ncbi:MAG: CUAEP/CCAEP-tail radical SAM (seleno)protein [Egibacteraceae bacterium]